MGTFFEMKYAGQWCVRGKYSNPMAKWISNSEGLSKKGRPAVS